MNEVVPFAVAVSDVATMTHPIGFAKFYRSTKQFVICVDGELCVTNLACVRHVSKVELCYTKNYTFVILTADKNPNVRVESKNMQDVQAFHEFVMQCACECIDARHSVVATQTKQG